MMREEYERMRIEKEGHPDDIYIIKPETNKDKWQIEATVCRVLIIELIYILSY